MPIDLQPTLRGTLLELRPLPADDSDVLCAAGSDPLTWEQHPERLGYTEYERPAHQLFSGFSF